MNDLLALLLQALEGGENLTITITIGKSQVPPQGKQFTAKCEQCGWEMRYSSQFAAKRGLQTHKNHCVKSLDRYTWLGEHKEDNETD